MALPARHSKQEFALDTMAEELTKLVEYGTGTGKTRIIVDASVEFVNNGEMPVLILVPNSLLEQTYEEFEIWAGRKWADGNVCPLWSSYPLYRRRELIKRGKSPVFILSHESLSYKLIREALQSREWAVVMVDEASRFRRYSKRTVTLRGVGRRAVSRYAFTGNLIVRSPADCWYITNWLRPGVWGTNDRDTFISTYFTLGGFTGTEPMGLRPDKRKEFFQVYDDLRIQCQLKDLRDLPERIMTVRHTDMGKEQHKAYEQMRKTLRLEIERLDDETFMSEAKTYATRLLRLQEIATGFGRNIEGDVVFFPSAKTEEMAEVLYDEPEVPTIVWYWFRPEQHVILKALKSRGIKPAVFGQPNAVQDFMKGRNNVFVCQLARGGFGLNLTRADRMLYHSLPWDLDLYSQSQERNVRFNKGKPVKGYMEVDHFVTRGTCEEYVRNKLLGKASMSRQFSRSQALEMLK